MTIEILTAELVHRERAAGHLRGIPRQQNETAIAKLYDRLNALHIARIETSGNAPIWPA